MNEYNVNSLIVIPTDLGGFNFVFGLSFNDLFYLKRELWFPKGVVFVFQIMDMVVKASWHIRATGHLQDLQMVTGIGSMQTQIWGQIQQGSIGPTKELGAPIQPQQCGGTKWKMVR